MLIKVSIHQIQTSKYMKETLTGDIEGRNHSIIIGDFNTPISIMNRTSRHKINKK